MRHGLRSSRAPLLLLLLLVMIFLSVQNTADASRFLRPLKPDHVKIKDAGGVGEEEPWNLMGMEACEGGTEECLERRLVSEAHLDYIYTQRHPKP